MIFVKFKFDFLRNLISLYQNLYEECSLTVVEGNRMSGGIKRKQEEEEEGGQEGGMREGRDFAGADTVLCNTSSLGSPSPHHTHTHHTDYIN